MTPYDIARRVGRGNSKKKTVIVVLFLFTVVPLVISLFIATRAPKPPPKISTRCDIFCKEFEMKREQEELRITQELKAWETFKKEQGIK